MTYRFASKPEPSYLVGGSGYYTHPATTEETRMLRFNHPFASGRFVNSTALSRLFRSALCGTVLLVAGLGVCQAATVQELDDIASRLLTANSKAVSGKIVADRSESEGFAAIGWDGSYSTIYVDPRKLTTETHNTWAFVLGHELAHHLKQHRANLRKEEFEADIYGARMAVNAGFNARIYIRRLYDLPNSCSRSHGCWHQRAHRLEQQLQIDVGKWSDSHSGHSPSSSHFPPSNR